MYKFPGTDVCSKLIAKYDKFLVYGDPDIDGLYATKLTIEFLKSQGKAYTYYINSNRQHGFLLSKEALKAFAGCCILAVDFAMTPEELQALVDNGISIICIDHHEVTYTCTQPVHIQGLNGAEGVLINNTYAFSDHDYAYLSGAGVCFNTFCCIDAAFDTISRRAYVGITLLSDSCPIENNDAATYLRTLFEWDSAESHALINALIPTTAYMYGRQRFLDREFIDYTFSPLLNAMCRFNVCYDALALIADPEHAGDCTVYKERQKPLITELLQLAQITDYGNLVTCCIETPDAYTDGVCLGNFIGVIANRLLGDYNKSVYVSLTAQGTFVRGSVRGRNAHTDYLQLFQSCGVQCAGHKAAFGVNVAPENSTEVFPLISKLIGEAELVAQNKGSDATIINISNLLQYAPYGYKAAIHNMYVRQEFRVYFDCTACSFEVGKRSTKSAYVEYLIDGVTVRCFSAELTPKNGLVQPMYSNGYVTYTLIPRKY